MLRVRFSRLGAVEITSFSLREGSWKAASSFGFLVVHFCFGNFEFGHSCLGALLDAIELVAPEALEAGGPFVHGPDRVGVGAVKHLATLATNVDQTDIAQNAQMFGDGGLLEAQGINDLADRAFFEREVVEDIAAARFGDSIKGVGGGSGPGHGI